MPDLTQINWDHLSAMTILGFGCVAFLRGWIVARPVFQVVITRLERAEDDRKTLLDALEKFAR